MKTNDNEHLAFEAHCEKEGLDRGQHPLHLLYLDKDTSKALTHFQAGYKAGNETNGNKSASVAGYAKFRCNKCKEIVTRNLGWKHWTPSFCEKTGLDARLYRITAPAKTENDIQYIA